ncbi:gamma-mobile-trio recombinase GmtY [Acinetobacter baumannii]
MVKIIAKIVEDNSGVYLEIPVLLDENQQVLMPLLEYILTLKRNGKSYATLSQYVNASKLLLEYMNANINCFATPVSLFEGFSSRLYTGTIGNDGLDPSGLYWLPHSKQVSRTYITALTKITDWLSAKYGEIPVNPLIEADSLEKRLNYAAWFRKNQHNFLGHIKDKYINSTVLYVRQIQGKRPLGKQFQDAIEFPEKYFEAFYCQGIGGAVDARVAIRDQLIVLLMHGGGLRESEAFHLWIEDVLIDQLNPSSVKVRIYHPADGKAPHNWRGRSGKTTRAAYLKEIYALSPRNDLIGKKHVGWKSRVTDSKDEYLEVHWFPLIFGEVFAKLWQNYTRFLAKIDRNHPYAFISFHRKHIGMPYTLNAFHDNYRQALKRIGLKSSKADGLSPHSHRHSYGRRLRRAEVPEVIIKKCLHHSALESQRVYTTPSIKEINNKLNAATERLLNPSELEEKNFSCSWEMLSEYSSTILGSTDYLHKWI